MRYQRYAKPCAAPKSAQPIFRNTSTAKPETAEYERKAALMTRADSDPARPETTLFTLDDFARAAGRVLRPEIRDFIAGGAGDERATAANREAFDRIRLFPRILTGAGVADTAVRVLGRAWPAPVGVAPVAYHTLVDPEGELATVRAAAAAGLPTVLSTFAGRTFKELGAAAGAPLWLQLYGFRDREVMRRLVRDAEDAGFEALVLTVDAPHLGRRLRDLRNGFRLPEHVRPANLPEGAYSSPAAHARDQMDPALDWSVIDWLRSVSALPLLLKGVLAAEDAGRAIGAGIDGIVVSNHGGRQLDAVPATLDALPAIARRVAGRIPVLIDGGVRRGVDVLAALALGADAVLVGRPVLYGLAVAGREGVARVLEILTEELREAMTLAGAGSVAQVSAGLLRTDSSPRPPRAERFTSELDPLGPHDPLETDGLPDPPETRDAASAGGIARARLHASLSDPTLDTMGFLNEVTDRFPEAISFAPGRPYEGFFDVESMFGYVRRYLDHLAAAGRSPQEVGRTLYQYGPAAGQIRDLIAESLREDEGVDVAAESIVVTVGAQEAMVLVLRALFAGPDDVLLVATPCYVGITGAAKLLDIRTVPVEEREDGLSSADVEAAIDAERARGRRVRALYLVPDHSNPSGNTVPAETRRELLELAARRDLLLIEDSPYRLVSPGERLPPLKALDTGRRVVQLGSFAKSAFPGARVGYAVADQLVVGPDGSCGLLADELAKIKSMVTVNTSPLSQAAVAGMLLASGGRLSALNAGPAAHYGENLRVLLHELDLRFPEQRRAVSGVRWNRPGGGFFLAVQVPFRADNAALERSAREYGVLWTPMAYFYPEGGGDHALRLAFSYLTPELIREGVARLAGFIEAESGRSVGRSAHG
jgi:(S)-3,5-dihydroxyphenylglycine transaminase